MTCPYCGFEAARRPLHRHLADAHSEAVGTEISEAEGQMFYVIACPSCGGRIRHQVKPRWTDPDFVREFGQEIRLVAFDLLLYHLEDAHSDDRQ
jgi:DNA-directed RNA polymerase subunit RPC12/RpoP